MLNKFIGMGRLTKDPELKTTDSGAELCRFTVAIDDDYAPKNGGERKTDFVDCVAFRHTAELIAKYFTKGRMICIFGSWHSRKWQDKEGNNRISWEVMVQDVYFCDSKKEAGSDQQSAQNDGQFTSTSAVDEGELPF